MKYLFCTILFVAALAYMAPSMVLAQGYYTYPQQPQQAAPQSPPQWDNQPSPPVSPPPTQYYVPQAASPQVSQPHGSINVPTGLLDQSSEQVPEPRCGNAQMFIIDPDGRATHKQIPVCQINGVWTVRQ